MNCVVTAGPTYESLDHVRRLTNLSTGRLGVELTNALTAHGHDVTLLRGEQATWQGQPHAARLQPFGSTADLSVRLEALSATPVDALFHAAAVSDFTFGKLWQHTADGEFVELHARKIPSRISRLLVEMIPTIKIIAHLRDWFPRALLVGWKYEVNDDHPTAVRRAEEQLAECRTDACVVNGPAYGTGFGLVTAVGQCAHFKEPATLYAALEALLRTANSR